MTDTAVLDPPLLDGSLDGIAIISLYKDNCAPFFLIIPFLVPLSTFCCCLTFSFFLF